jgi:hypothetical protein
VRAVLDADQDRLAELAAISDELVRQARQQVTGNDAGDQYLATVQGWAAILRPENHHPRQAGNSVVIEYQHPGDVAEILAPSLLALDRGNTAYRLQGTYAVALAEGRAVPTDSLREDIAAARDFAADPPGNGPVRIIDPIAAVAAAGVIAHAQGRIELSAADLGSPGWKV